MYILMLNGKRIFMSISRFETLLDQQFEGWSDEIEVLAFVG